MDGPAPKTTTTATTRPTVAVAVGATVPTQAFKTLDADVSRVLELQSKIEKLTDRPKPGPASSSKSSNAGAMIMQAKDEIRNIQTRLERPDSALREAMTASAAPAVDPLAPLDKMTATLRAAEPRWSDSQVQSVADALVKSTCINDNIPAVCLALSTHFANPEYTPDNIVSYVQSDIFQQKLKILRILLDPHQDVVAPTATPAELDSVVDLIKKSFGNLTLEPGSSTISESIRVLANYFPAEALARARPYFNRLIATKDYVTGLTINATARMSLKEIETRVPPSLPERDLGNILREKWGTTMNKYPIVLVHGWAGFGKPILNTLNYFGGLGDTAKYLTSLGYEVHVVSVGPFSSNWERACEIYAQLTGTVVDYGEARSKRFGFSRYGRDYRGKGLVPNWGKDPNSKVNFIAHSMGGNTVHMLTSLLARGYEDEVTGTTDPESLSPLFARKKDGASRYVNGVVALNSPFMGTTLDDIILTQPVKDIVKTIVAVSEALGEAYDPNLDQWGFKWERDKETYEAFVERVANSKWAQTQSYSGFDLLTDTQEDPLLAFPRIEDDVYYFSQTAYATMPNPLTGTEIPSLSMNPILDPFSLAIGTRTFPEKGIGREWLQNDGVVNTISMKHPKNAPYDENWGNIDLTLDTDLIMMWESNKPAAPEKKPAKNVGPPLRNFDHVAVVGTLSPSPHYAYKIAQNCAAILSSTPA